MKIEINEAVNRNEILLNRLVHVWEASVRKTHLFLSNAEIENIKKYVPLALENVAHLIVASDGNNNIPGFMGIEDCKLEMLFLDPQERGKGLGRKLIEYGIENYNVNEVVVNEQNPEARGFYEHIGFKVYKRCDNDEQGNPYPILYMKLR